MKKQQILQQAFALPTVLITSIIMLVVLMAALVGTTSIDAVVRDQYYTRLVKEASEAGMAMAEVCLRSLNYDIPAGHYWKTNNLTPDKNCDGTNSGAGLNFIDNGKVKVSFQIAPPSTALNGAQKISVKGIVGRIRNSNSASLQTYSSTTVASMSAQSTFGSITFGYAYVLNDPTNGAQFSVLLPDKTVRSVGRNANGRLGNGSTTDALGTPTNPIAAFNNPSNTKVASIFSNAGAMGQQTCVITTDGSVFSAGSNNAGQLGNGAVSTSQSTPVRFGTVLGEPGNPSTTHPKAVYVANIHYQYGGTGTHATFVMSDDKNIYAAGSCNKGVLGVTCTNGSNVTTPKRVELPLPTSDDTTPDTDWSKASEPTNFNTELTPFLRMKGGAVYGWGPNGSGALADGTFTDSQLPKRIQAIRSFPPAPKPQVTPYDIEADAIDVGSGPYLIEKDTGQLWTSGYSRYGQSLGAGTFVRSVGMSAACLYRASNGAIKAQRGPSSVACNEDLVKNTTNPTDWLMEWWPDGTWRIRKDHRTSDRSDITKFWCITSPGTIATFWGGDPVYAKECVQDSNGNPAANQVWKIEGTQNGEFIIKSNFGSPGCIYITNYESNVVMNNCNAGDGKYVFTLHPTPYLRPVPALPKNSNGTLPKITRISSDNGGAVLIDDQKRAWGAGGNNRGQLGVNATANSISLPLKQVDFSNAAPGDSTLVADVYNSEAEPSYTTYEGAKFNNSYFVMTDGNVFGAGANDYGQLGIGSQDTSSHIKPKKMSKLADLGLRAKNVQSGFGTTVILTTGGQIYTVGNNSNGQIGNATVPIGSYTTVPLINSYISSVAPLRY